MTRRRRNARRRQARKRLRRSMFRRHGERLTVAGLWHYVLERDVVWVVFLVLAGTWIMVPTDVFFGPGLSEGEIASRDHHATRDVLIPDEATSEELKQRARSGVRPLYDFDASQAEELEGRIGRLFEIERGFDEVADLLREEDVTSERRLRLREGSDLRVDESHAELLAARTGGENAGAELEERLVQLVGFLLRAGIVENKETLLQNRLEGVTLRNLRTGEESVQFDLFGYRGYPVEVESYLEEEVGRWGGWSRSDRETVVDFLMVNLAPNIYLNLNETQERRNAEAEKVGQVFNQIRAGQVIVRKGELVDREAISLLQEMRGSERTLPRLRSPLASALLLGLAVAFLWDRVPAQASGHRRGRRLRRRCPAADPGSPGDPSRLRGGRSARRLVRDRGIRCSAELRLRDSLRRGRASGVGSLRARRRVARRPGLLRAGGASRRGGGRRRGARTGGRHDALFPDRQSRRPGRSRSGEAAVRGDQGGPAGRTRQHGLGDGGVSAGRERRHDRRLGL